MTAMIIMIIIMVSNDDEKQQQLSVWLQCARLWSWFWFILVHLNFRIGHWYYLHSAEK